MTWEMDSRSWWLPAVGCAMTEHTAEVHVSGDMTARVTLGYPDRYNLWHREDPFSWSVQTFVAGVPRQGAMGMGKTLEEAAREAELCVGVFRLGEEWESLWSQVGV